jgi:hypothetical protein
MSGIGRHNLAHKMNVMTFYFILITVVLDNCMKLPSVWASILVQYIVYCFCWSDPQGTTVELYVLSVTVHVPDRRGLGRVNFVCVIVLACVGRKRGKWGGQWELGKGP